MILNASAAQLLYRHVLVLTIFLNCGTEEVQLLLLGTVRVGATGHPLHGAPLDLEGTGGGQDAVYSRRSPRRQWPFHRSNHVTASTWLEKSKSYTFAVKQKKEKLWSTTSPSSSESKTIPAVIRYTRRHSCSVRYDRAYLGCWNGMNIFLSIFWNMPEPSLTGFMSTKRRYELWYTGCFLPRRIS